MKRRLVTVSDSRSFIAEQFRTIRANIKFATPDREMKTLLITSSTQGEGKSTNAANLAIVFAQDGKRVLLVDADMRKPTMHYTFACQNRIGLSTVLSNQHDIDSAISPTDIEHLSIVTSGPIPPNQAELLSSQQFDQFIQAVKQRFDFIIFDAPPILAASDAQILANKCDGTLLVVHARKAEKDAVIKAKAQLDTAKANIIGATLNQTKLPKKHHYYV